MLLKNFHSYQKEGIFKFIPATHNIRVSPNAEKPLIGINLNMESFHLKFSLGILSTFLTNSSEAWWLPN